MSKKKRYEIRNWNAYNRALIDRGSLTLLIDEEAAHKQRCNREKNGRRGRDPTYGDRAHPVRADLEGPLPLALASHAGTGRFAHGVDGTGSADADGAYDTRRTYRALSEHGARVCIPPRENITFFNGFGQRSPQNGTNLFSRHRFRKWRVLASVEIIEIAAMRCETLQHPYVPRQSDRVHCCWFFSVHLVTLGRFAVGVCVGFKEHFDHTEIKLRGCDDQWITRIWTGAGSEWCK